MRAGRVHLIVEAESSPDLKMAPSLSFLSTRVTFATITPIYPISTDYAAIVRVGAPAMVRAYPSRVENKRGVCGPFPRSLGAILTCLQHRCHTTYWSASSKNMDCSGLKNTLAPDRVDSSDA